MGLRNVLLGALVALSAVALAAGDAQAFWGSRGSWGSYGGSWGSNGSSGSSGSWGSRGSYGSHGSHGGLFRRHRNGSSGGSWGSSGGSYGSNGSSGSHGSNGSAGGHASYYGNGGGSYAVSNTDSAPTLVTSAAAKTTLTVRVPADAKITLAGIETKQAGEVREFATSKLAAGQTWSNYTIHVEVTRDGKTMSQDRTILLTGGQSQELSFDLGGMQVASAN